MQNINKINIKQSEKINKIIMHNTKIINKNKKITTTIIYLQ